jgi:hypothetical protein
MPMINNMTYISVERSVAREKGKIIDSSTSATKYRSGMSGDYELVVINKDISDAIKTQNTIVTASPSFQSES